nr:transposase [Streptomyces inhibens]
MSPRARREVPQGLSLLAACPLQRDVSSRADDRPGVGQSGVGHSGVGLVDRDPQIGGQDLAARRWRIEHDYRELKHGLGLDHFEGRSWNGWHHHVTLVTAAHAFLTEHRLSPKARTPASRSTRFSTPPRAC